MMIEIHHEARPGQYFLLCIIKLRPEKSIFSRKLTQFTDLDRANVMNPKYILHNTGVAWFLTAKCFKKIPFLIQTVTECRSPIQLVLYDTFKAEIGQLFVPQSTF